MDTDNDKYWRNRVEKAEMQRDNWHSLVLNYVYVRENGLDSQISQAYAAMLKAIEQENLDVPIAGVQFND